MNAIGSSAADYAHLSFTKIPNPTSLYPSKYPRLNQIVDCCICFPLVRAHTQPEWPKRNVKRSLNPRVWWWIILRRRRHRPPFKQATAHTKQSCLLSCGCGLFPFSFKMAPVEVKMWKLGPSKLQFFPIWVFLGWLVPSPVVPRIAYLHSSALGDARKAQDFVEWALK